MNLFNNRSINFTIAELFNENDVKQLYIKHQYQAETLEEFKNKTGKQVLGEILLVAILAVGERQSYS